METPVTISLKDAKNIILNSQGLTHSTNNLSVIQQLSYIQIDTISVTERCHNHIFFTRNPNFNKEDINDLMKSKSIFEYWSHAAAYLPIKDYRYSLYPKEKYRTGTKHWFPRDKKVEKFVLDRIKNEGPLQSKDFENPNVKNHNWYEWKPAKTALTNLFIDGSLMIANRKGFQKIFDLTERIAPSNINTSIPSINEYCLHLINNAIKAQGIVTLNEICYLRKNIKPTVKKILQELVENKDIQPIQVDNYNEIYYTTIANPITSTNNSLHILSPFDNLTIQRKRLKTIFNFEFQLECYVPEKKRKFGYYTLPILFGEEFVARLDAKADRKTKLFTIKNIWFESSFQPSEEFYKEMASKLHSYSTFCGCDKINLEKTYPNSYKSAMKNVILNAQ